MQRWWRLMKYSRHSSAWTKLWFILRFLSSTACSKWRSGVLFNTIKLWNPCCFSRRSISLIFLALDISICTFCKWFLHAQRSFYCMNVVHFKFMLLLLLRWKEFSFLQIPCSTKGFLLRMFASTSIKSLFGLRWWGHCTDLGWNRIIQELINKLKVLNFEVFT